ncbi:hypothetical protein V8G54_037130, partial [Vigna mungo]
MRVSLRSSPSTEKSKNLHVCDNLVDHMAGNVYAKFREEEHAANTVRNFTGRFYAGRSIIVDFSLVTNFRGVPCSQYEENTCNHRGCNFMHLQRINRDLRHQLIGKHHRRNSRSRVLTGIAAMMSGPILVIAKSNMTGTTIMRVVVVNAGARVLTLGEEEV